MRRSGIGLMGVLGLSILVLAVALSASLAPQAGTAGTTHAGASEPFRPLAQLQGEHTGGLRETPMDAAGVAGVSLAEGAVETGRLRLTIEALASGNARTPGTGISVMLTPQELWEAEAEDSLARTTGPTGEATWSDLVPGRYLVEAPGIGQRYCRIERDCETSISFLVDCLTEVEGTVVTPSGVPVPGAKIWVSHAGSKQDGAIATEADERGEFRARIQLGVQKWIRAIADGYEVGPAEPLESGGASRGCIVTRLLLIPGGGLVTGHVQEPSGAPVPGARVRLFSMGVAMKTPHDPVMRYRDCPVLTTTTDGLGQFRIQSIPMVGRPTVEVHAPGFASAAVPVTVLPDERDPITIRLEPEASLLGTVIDENGDPVAGAIVRSGRLGQAGCRTTTADLGGRFSLDGLQSGPCIVGFQRRGYDSTEFECSLLPGEERQAGTIVLSRRSGACVEGTIDPPRPSPDGLWTIVVEAGGHAEMRITRNGKWRTAPVPTGPARIRVYASGSDEPVHTTQIEIPPEETVYGPVDLVLEAASARVVGKLIGPRLESGERLQVVFHSVGSRQCDSTQPDFRTGEFEHTIVGGGVWSMRVMSPDGKVEHSQVLGSASRGLIDLGTIRVGTTGTLKLTLPGAASAKVRVFDESGFMYWGRRLSGVSEVELPQGAYQITTDSIGGQVTAPIQINEGQTAVLDLAQRSLQTPTLQFVCRGNWDAGTWIRVCGEDRTHFLRPDEGKLVKFYGPPGTYRLETGRGSALDLTLPVSAGADGQEVVELYSPPSHD